MKTSCVPRKQHDETHEDVLQQGPNIYILCVQYHIRKNNTTEIVIQAWCVHVVEVGQNKHIQRL